MITHTIESYWIPSPRRRQSWTYKFKEFAKITHFWILKQTLHATHLLKLLDKMCKYEMGPTGIDEDTKRTRLCPQTDRQTRWNQYTPPFNFVEEEGIIKKRDEPFYCNSYKLAKKILSCGSHFFDWQSSEESINPSLRQHCLSVGFMNTTG